MATTAEINFTVIDCDDSTNLFQHIADLWNSTEIGGNILFYNITDDTKPIVFDWLDQVPSNFQYREFYQTYFTVRKVK